MVWFYLPLAVTVISGLFYVWLETLQDQSGAGMVGLFLLFPIIGINLVIWLFYFVCKSFFGIT